MHGLTLFARIFRQPTSSMLLMWRVLVRRIKEEQEGKSLPNFDLIRYLTTRALPPFVGRRFR